ncbi:RidA family protein [Nocardioides sp. AN3]
MTNGTSNKKLRPSPGYSKSRQAERTLYLSGDIGLDYATGVLPEGGIEAEIHQLMGNLSATAQSAGFTLNDFVATTVYVTSWDFYPTFDDIYKTYFQEPYPARATVQVAGLVAGASIEISAVASKA